MEISYRVLFIILLFITAAIVGIIVYFVTDEENLKSLQQSIPDVPDSFPSWSDLFGREDPFNGINETYSWPNNGTGLKLTILNALESEWHSYFYTAIEQWDDGDPDSLTLQTEMRPSPDFNCSTERGYMKVCNGNYGATGWTGINKIVMGGGGKIMSSAARMNEYYFRSSSSTGDSVTDSKDGNNDADSRQYTMCHEIGHGFGLPHTDEKFGNDDLGNCLDYTSNPATNKQPGVDNYKRLMKLYGKVSRWSHDFDTDKDADETTASAIESMSIYETSSSTNSGNGTRIRTRRVNQIENFETKKTLTNDHYPDWIAGALYDIDSLFQVEHSIHDSIGQVSTSHHFKRLFSKYSQRQQPVFHRNRHTYFFDIGQGYKVHVSLLSVEQ